MKELLRTLIPAMKHMPKIDRIDGAPMEMKRAAFKFIEHFSIAYECEDVRLKYIHRMFGDYAKLQAAFEISLYDCHFYDHEQINIAFRMERIKEGLVRWYRAQNPLRQEQKQVDAKSEAFVSIL